jgi:nondiscriminating aspartyl-tRNA synthetase
MGKRLTADSLGSWRRTHYADQLKQHLDGTEVIVFGWVQEIRDLGGIRFIQLRDKSGLMQVTLPKKLVSKKVLEKCELLQTQSAVAVKGVVRKLNQAQREVEIIPSEIRTLGAAKHPLPIDPKGRVPANLDVRLDNRILDVRRPEINAIFKIRHTLTQALRNYLSKNGYVEISTPKIIETAVEGGAALFRVKYYGRNAYLAQSPQLYKEELISSFEKVFEIAPYFRAEVSHTRRHLSEFISVDLEEAFTTCEDVMKTLENLICEAVSETIDLHSAELKLLHSRLVKPRTPFPRFTYEEILEKLGSVGMKVEWGEDLSTSHLRTLGGLIHGFYFITEWPTRAKVWYIKPREDNPELCEAFDLMYGWLEIASGGSRINDRTLLERRLQSQGLNPESFRHHLKVYDLGMPPHAGWGMGLDRLVQVVVGKTNIREVVLFPRDRFRIAP